MAGERPGVPPAASHWAFLPPRRPAPPEVSTPGWARNPIDRFILARLEQPVSHPRRKPIRPTLLRRLASTSSACPRRPRRSRRSWPIDPPSAYERAVDRLMASPHFGERWARPWLDQARYADSNGYSIDAPRSIWKYRDWVIAAFNARHAVRPVRDRSDRRRPSSGDARWPSGSPPGSTATRRSTRKAGSTSSSSASSRSSIASTPPGRSSSA